MPPTPPAHGRSRPSAAGRKEIEQTIKLEQKDGKVTGTISGGKNDTKIEDGKFKDNEVTFTVTRERRGVKIVSKYVGKVTDDGIKGTITTDRDGKEDKQDWDAKKAGRRRTEPGGSGRI